MTFEPHAPAAPGHWPKELRLSAGGKILKVSFESGRGFDLPAEYLRVMSPSAELQGHVPAERKTLGGKQNVAITEVAPVGSYAVRLSFDDLHTTGIYTWDYLYELGARQTEKWSHYLAELQSKGLRRDRPGEK